MLARALNGPECMCGGRRGWAGVESAGKSAGCNSWNKLPPLSDSFISHKLPPPPPPRLLTRPPHSFMNCLRLPPASPPAPLFRELPPPPRPPAAHSAPTSPSAGREGSLFSETHVPLVITANLLTSPSCPTPPPEPRSVYHHPPLLPSPSRTLHAPLHCLGGRGIWNPLDYLVQPLETPWETTQWSKSEVEQEDHSPSYPSPPSPPRLPPGCHALGLLDAFHTLLVLLLALSGRYCRGFVQDLCVRGGEGEVGKEGEGGTPCHDAGGHVVAAESPPVGDQLTVKVPLGSPPPPSPLHT